MGFFSKLGMAAGNWMEFKNLDSGSDLHISDICQFEPYLLNAQVRKNVSEAVKQLMTQNYGPPYTVEDVALIKLIMYCRMFLDSFGASDVNCQKIVKGMRKLLASGDVNPSISLEARILVMDNFPTD